MSKSKQTGTRFETSLLPLLRDYYPDAERLPLQGSADRGDFTLPGERRFVLEAKCRQRMDLAGGQAEADVEARNAGVPYGVQVHKRRGKAAPGDQWAVMPLGTFLALVNPP